MGKSRAGGGKDHCSGLEDPPKYGGCAWWERGVWLLGETTRFHPVALTQSSFSVPAFCYHVLFLCVALTKYSEWQSVRFALSHSGPGRESVLAVYLLNQQLTK